MTKKTLSSKKLPNSHQRDKNIKLKESDNYKEQLEIKCCYNCKYSYFGMGDTSYSELYCDMSFNIPSKIVCVIGICDKYET